MTERFDYPQKEIAKEQGSLRALPEKRFENALARLEEENRLAIMNAESGIENSIGTIDINIEMMQECLSEENSIQPDKIKKYEEELLKAAKVREKLLEIKNILEQQ